MEVTSVDKYFSQVLKSLPPDLLNTLRSLFEAINLKTQKNFTLPMRPQRSLKQLIAKLKNPETIEEKIKTAKLRAAMISKKQLEAKLQQINQNIEDLNSKSPKSPFKILETDQNSKKKLLQEEQKRAEDLAEAIKKFSKLRKESEKNFQLQSEKIKRKVKKLEESDLKLAVQMKEIREKTRLKHLEKLRETREKRENFMQNLKNSQTASPDLREKPLFLKLEENFKQKVEMPALEKRKEELRKKSAFFAPINQETLKNHEKWYQNQKKLTLARLEHERKERMSEIPRSTSVNLNSWALRIMEEDRKAEEVKIKNNEDKKKRLEMKAKYSELIQELLAPYEPDFESQLRKKSTNPETRTKKIRDSASVDSKNWKPHVFQPNPMIPPPRAVKEPKQVDYLESKRKKRLDLNKSTDNEKTLESFINSRLGETSSKSDEDLKVFVQAASRLEEIARKKELAAETKPLSINSINQSKSVDKLIITSIKAKLKVLENL